MFRHPRTIQEKRNAANAEEQGAKFRNRTRRLPTSWSDIQQPCYKTWKNYRNKQYRPVVKSISRP